MEPKVSVIVPVYNVEAFLPGCLDSLLGQTLRDIEVICVDDGSGDASLDILRRYEAADRRIRVIPQRNKGQGGARNRGFDAVSGEYVAYVDSDDWVDRDYLEKLYRAAERWDAEVACAGVIKERRCHRRWQLMIREERVYDDANEKFAACACPPVFNATNKLYSRAMLMRLKIRFRERTVYEDVEYTMRAICECGRLVTVPDTVYHYRVHADSTTKGVQTPRKQRDKYNAHRRFVAYADAHGIRVDGHFRSITRRNYLFGGISWLKAKDDGRRVTYRLFNYFPVWSHSVGKNLRDGALTWGEDREQGMTIAFDAKRITHNATGLGNYGRMMIDMLVRFAPENRYLLFTPDSGRDDLRERVPAVPQVVFCYPERPRRGAGKTLWRSFGICFELPADLTLFHGLAGELPFGLWKTGVKSVVTIHDLIFLRYPSYYKWIDRQIYALKYRKACEHADRVIAISEATKRDIIAYFGIPARKIDVVYQGCDESFKREVPAEIRRGVRARYNLPEHYILYVGSIEKRKNLLLVLEAVARMPERVHVVAIGRRTPYARQVEAFAEAHKLAPWLHIFDRVPFADLPAFYQMADLFVYPSRFEGFGIPVIEAAYSGIPTIGARGSCLEEAGGPDAVYVDPDDPQGLADRIREILGNEALRRRMVERGRAYVARFEPEVLVADLLEVYRKVVEEP